MNEQAEQNTLLTNEKVQQQIQIKKRLSEQNRSNKQNNVQGLPPGNKLAQNWIVLDLGIKPTVEDYNLWSLGDQWQIKFVGLNSGESERVLTIGEIKQLGLQEFCSDWHCVTGWSTKNLKFKGIPMQTLLDFLKPQLGWVCLWQVGADSYTVNVHRDDVQHAFIAIYDENDEFIQHEHGGVRIVFPTLFGWKSAKWLTEVHFLNQERSGFWEKLYCHPRGRIEYNERWHTKGEGVWNTLVSLMSIYYYILPYDWVVWMMQISGAVLGWFTLRFSYIRKGSKQQSSLKEQ
eukprot:TRINITY_DN43802_c0_g1_i7.p2 TRINITY_DN43802_c0_g1~~TRINITY_DN43802_c0_g1_i7.p2  ORF type:complete len:299 (+),score=25.55 TRINITY_DN43802_c0_g1_i7:33-899(+)